MVTSTTAPNRPLPDYHHSSMALPHLNNCGNPHIYHHQHQNPDIRQHSSAFGIATGGLQQQPMVPTLLNMITQLTSLLNESYARQNVNIQSQSKEHELNKKIEQLAAEVQYYKEECNRLKEEKTEVREKWGKSNWYKWIEKNRLREEKEYFQKKLEIKRGKCKVLENNAQQCTEEITNIQKKWKDSVCRIRGLEADIKYWKQEYEHLNEHSAYRDRVLETEVKLLEEASIIKEEQRNSIIEELNKEKEKVNQHTEENRNLQCELQACKEYSKSQDEEIHWLQEECDRIEEETAAIQQKWDETNFYNILIEKDMKFY